ncbi:hypothetical protein YC2023_103274 [Brassica napus]
MGAKNKNLGYLSNIDRLPSRLFQSLIHAAWRFVVWSEDAVVGKVFCSGEAARLDQGLTPGGGGFYSSVVVGIFREVEAPFAPPPPVQFSGGGGLPSSVVAVLSPEGGGYHSSTLPAWNP